MSEIAVEAGSGLVEPPRRRRSAEDRLRVVEETLVAGASVARVARKYGINANQVFQWRRQYREGRLGGERRGEMKLLPVAVTDAAELATRDGGQRCSSVAGAIHIEFPGRALVSVEGRVDPSVVRAVMESLRQ